jgi:hypothetical protein
MFRHNSRKGQKSTDNTQRTRKWVKRGRGRGVLYPFIPTYGEKNMTFHCGPVISVALEPATIDSHVWICHDPHAFCRAIHSAIRNGNAKMDVRITAMQCWSFVMTKRRIPQVRILPERNDKETCLASEALGGCKLSVRRKNV